MVNEVRIASASDLSPGEMRGYEIGESRILLANIEGQFYAMDGICGHAMADLDEGDLNGKNVLCPFHASEFDVTTGRYIDGPSGEDQKTYTVNVKNGEIFVEI